MALVIINCQLVTTSYHFHKTLLRIKRMQTCLWTGIWLLLFRLSIPLDIHRTKWFTVYIVPSSCQEVLTNTWHQFQCLFLQIQPLVFSFTFFLLYFISQLEQLCYELIGCFKGMRYFKWVHNIWATTCDFQQCGILTLIDPDETVQPFFKLVFGQ